MEGRGRASIFPWRRREGGGELEERNWRRMRDGKGSGGGGAMPVEAVVTATRELGAGKAKD